MQPSEGQFAKRERKKAATEVKKGNHGVYRGREGQYQHRIDEIIVSHNYNKAHPDEVKYVSLQNDPQTGLLTLLKIQCRNEEIDIEVILERLPDKEEVQIFREMLKSEETAADDDYELW
jgi:hypothetical protein